METEILLELQNITKLLQTQNLLKKEVLDFDEACAYLNVSASFLYKKTANNSIAHYSPTKGKLFFKRSEIDQWVFANRQATNDEIEQTAADYIINNKRRSSL